MKSVWQIIVGPFDFHMDGISGKVKTFPAMRFHLWNFPQGGRTLE